MSKLEVLPRKTDRGDNLREQQNKVGASKMPREVRNGKTLGSGRLPGVPNKATADARAAIAKFVDGNAHRLQKWLDEVAEGKPMLGADGQQLFDDDGRPMWIVPPNPEKAHNMFQSVIEYHVPKLARSELTGANGGMIGIAAVDLKGLSDDDLAAMQQLLSKAAQ